MICIVFCEIMPHLSKFSAFVGTQFVVCMGAKWQYVATWGRRGRAVPQALVTTKGPLPQAAGARGTYRASRVV